MALQPLEAIELVFPPTECYTDDEIKSLAEADEQACRNYKEITQFVWRLICRGSVSDNPDLFWSHEQRKFVRRERLDDRLSLYHIDGYPDPIPYIE